MWLRMPANSDNAAPTLRQVPIVGRVGPDGRVTITDSTWRPAPQLQPVDSDGPAQS